MADIYEEFKARLLLRLRSLLGVSEDDLGAVINERQLESMMEGVRKAEDEGATILCGGDRASEPTWQRLLRGQRSSKGCLTAVITEPASCSAQLLPFIASKATKKLWSG